MLQFIPFVSSLETTFWEKLSNVKLNEYGLDDKLIAVKGYYCNSLSDKLSSVLNINYDAFDCTLSVPSRCLKVMGSLKITNTIDDFKSCDKTVLIREEGKKIWNAITGNEALKDPGLLTRFLLLTYADLKRFKFYYWCAFPALNIPEKLMLVENPVTISEGFSEAKISMLMNLYDELSSRDGGSPSAFLIRDSLLDIKIGTFEDFEEWKNSGDEIILAFSDPGTSPSNPGWPLRNLLAFVAYHWHKDLNGTIKVLCLKDRVRSGKRQVSHSLFLHVKLPDISNLTECPKVVGWEKDEKDSLKHKFMDLSSQMDPLKLCESAVDLNLRLMKWRLVPQLDLDTISSTRFLLLGSGTLGCNVARCLLGWGVRNVTLVDNSNISFSNPIRQSLFTFQDCIDGGKQKAHVAAQSLKLIFPQVNAVGLDLSIPMPGHFVSCKEMEKVKRDVEELERLIDSHDVIYLLMDTRESRWLPTLIGRAKSKIVLSVALGFDSYLVIRHGVGFSESETNENLKNPKSIPGSKLGCYFCNDVTSPGNSTLDRTLDQQCTVTRPGASMIAAASSVEVVVSLLNHPLRGRAPASSRSNLNDNYIPEEECILGFVPHQIRGFLSSFNNVLPANHSFDKCTACSDKVLEAYRKDGFDFLYQVFNSPNILEDLTGLTQLTKEAADFHLIEFGDDDEAEVIFD